MSVDRETHVEIEIAIDDAHYALEAAYEPLDRLNYLETWRALRAAALEVNKAMRVISRARKTDLRVAK